MKESNTKLSELMDVLNRDGIYSTEELAQELDVSKRFIHSLIREWRRKFLDGGKDIKYVYSAAGGGYTVQEAPEHVVWESKKRLSMGFGVIANGVFVFKRCKRIAAKEFAALNIQYRPQMLTVKQLIAK